MCSFLKRMNADLSIRNETGRFVAVCSLAPPLRGEGWGEGHLSANTEIAAYAEPPPHPPRRSRRPLPAGGERLKKITPRASASRRGRFFPREAALIVRRAAEMAIG